MRTTVTPVRKLVTDRTEIPEPWDGLCVKNEDNLCWVLWNPKTHEGLIVDPVREDWDTLVSTTKRIDVRWIAVLDTHTHADHISSAADLAGELGSVLMMSERAPSKRVALRVSRELKLPLASAPLHLIPTPGHTPDSLCFFWGPWMVVGDTILYGDIGRDDLPGGDVDAHYESIQILKSRARPEQLFLTNHDQESRVTSWNTQLTLNSLLHAPREVFVKECGEYRGPSPKNLKESLFENMK
jgi:glyoxylase-like metal-dependent hydrolase (beta-lactamase superfamily II)